MFGLNLEWDAWAVLIGLTYFALRVGHALVRLVRWHLSDSLVGFMPPFGFSFLVSFAAGAAVGVGGFSLAVEPWFAAPGYLYVICGMFGVALGLAVEAALMLRLMRLADWLRGFHLPRYRDQLQDPDEEVRHAAAFKLMHLGPRAYPAVPELLDALKDRSERLRCTAASALAVAIPDPPPANDTATPAAVRPLLASPDIHVRTAAAVVLAKYGAPASEVLPALCAAVPWSAQTRADLAAEAIGRLGPAAEPAIPVLRDAALETEQPNPAAVIALGKIGPAAVPVLVEILERGEMLGQYHAVAALDGLGQAAGPALLALRMLALRTTSFASFSAKRLAEKLEGVGK